MIILSLFAVQAVCFASEKIPLTNRRKGTYRQLPMFENTGLQLPGSANAAGFLSLVHLLEDGGVASQGD